ncbi:MAG: hypothetical protein ACI4VU_01740 [Methanobrevibacter sp.]
MYKLNSWNKNEKFFNSKLAGNYINKSTISTACGSEINTACGSEITATACGSEINTACGSEVTTACGSEKLN